MINNFLNMFFLCLKYGYVCLQYIVFLLCLDVLIKILYGYYGRVISLLYSFNESIRYEFQYLLSGGADFFVMFWDIYIGCKFYIFIVYGGEIIQLLCLLNNCNVSFIKLLIN